MPPTVLWIGLAAALAAGGFLFLRARRAPKEEVLFYMKCPACNRKMRYRARQVGHAGMCPRCNRTFTFPPGSAAGK
jgi:hypothetical protein